MAIIFLLIVVLVVASAVVPKFATPVTMGYLLFDITPLLFIALAMAPVMITGDIDLSVGSMVGLSSVTVGLCSQAGLGIPVAMLVALLVGAIGGAVNGLLITRIGLPALAVTIGTLALYRGIAVGLLGTTAITSFDKWWTTLIKSKIGTTGVPTVMILFVVLLAAFTIMLHFTPFGRGVFAIGLSKDAAVFSGVNAERTRLILFVLLRPDGRPRRHLLRALLHVRPRRQRHGDGAAGDRSRRARRRLRLRRTRRAARCDRRRRPDRRAVRRPCSW